MELFRSIVKGLFKTIQLVVAAMIVVVTVPFWVPLLLGMYVERIYDWSMGEDFQHPDVIRVMGLPRRDE
jgi:hypothetical protein